MNISFDEKTKLYTAYQVSDNKPCIAFSESRLEAEQFCFDLVQKNRNQLSKELESRQTYRFETGTLFEYSKEHKAYLAVFTDYRYQTKAAAIKAYEGQV